MASVEYKLVRGIDRADEEHFHSEFEAEVARLLCEGWVLVGPPTVTVVGLDNLLGPPRFMYHQAMTRTLAAGGGATQEGVPHGGGGR